MPKLCEVAVEEFVPGWKDAPPVMWCVQIFFGDLEEDGLPVNANALKLWKTFACPFPSSLECGWACVGDYEDKSEAEEDADR